MPGPELILVGGSPRSGTTLMHHILSTDPRSLAIPHEAKFLGHFLTAYRLSKQEFAAYNRHFFADLAALQAHSRAFFAGVFSGLAPKPDDVLVLKDPAATLSLAEALEIFPASRCVLMLRDPRDIVASLLAVGQRLEGTDADYTFTIDNLPGVIHYAIKHYAQTYALLQDESARTRILPVYYERLVLQPEAELERLRNFTGLALNGYRPDQPWAGDPPPRDPIQQAWVSELNGQALSQRRIGNYRNTLPPQAIWLIETSCRPFFQIFGYQPEYDKK
ncbi:MAG TPA: sulfotransferase [Candidatus Obscuribacterales bacterium]